MNVSRRSTLALLAAAPSPLLAQGFAGLGGSAEGFALPAPDPDFRFPDDHGAHPDFRIEWWYVTAVLQSDDGSAYGIQWTLFRSALEPEERPGWSSPQIWFAHAALTTPNRHFVAERLARGGIGQAGVTTAPFAAWIDDWQMTGQPDTSADALANLSLDARGNDFSYQLDLKAKAPLVLQGKRGYSVKSTAGQASYYYAQPFYQVAGQLTLPEGTVEVSGQAWLDREWSSQPLAPNQSGWDWFALHLAGGEKVMLFQLRDDGPGFRQGNWIAPDGQNGPLNDDMIRLTPLASTQIGDLEIPTEWRLEVPTRGLDVTTTPLNPMAWMGTGLAYWEGPIELSGTHQGRGYLEMTGYD